MAGERYNEEFKDLPPSQIVPALADKGEYMPQSPAFIASCMNGNSNTIEGALKHPQKGLSVPMKRSNQIKVSVGILHRYRGLPEVSITTFTWYWISTAAKVVVGWEVPEKEPSDSASRLVSKAHLSEDVGTKLLMLHHKGFPSIKGAPAWTLKLVHWYIHEHKHHRIRFIWLVQPHAENGSDILKG